MSSYDAREIANAIESVGRSICFVGVILLGWFVFRAWAWAKEFDLKSTTPQERNPLVH